MKKVELTYYEINDLVRILEYTKDKKREEYKKGELIEPKLLYELNIINKIIDKISKK